MKLQGGQKGQKSKHHKKNKNHKKKHGEAKHPQTPAQVFRKKAPRRKVNPEITINSSAFQGSGNEFKLFS